MRLGWLRVGGLARAFVLVALFLGAAVAGTIGGVLFAFAGDLPQISALDDFEPSTITRVLGRDGATIAEFASERRVLVTYDQIPEVLRQAIIAAEDADFFRHGGLNLRRIVVAGVKQVLRRPNAGGASTLTQMLTRKLFLTDEQTLERKLKEWVLAVQVEKRYTKQEIFTMFCNKVYWGHGAYGVQAASDLFFAKSVKDLTLGEAAMIAGIIQGNARQSPYNNMAAAVRRRNYTLDRMAAEGFISRTAAGEAKQRPIETRGAPGAAPSLAPYFAETVRVHLEERYGAKALYESGLVVRTGLDPALQRAATVALDAGLRAIDKRRGFRRPADNVLAAKKSLETYRHPRWAREPVPGDIAPALVVGTEGGVIRLRVGKRFGLIDRAGLAWTRRGAADLVTPGDLVEIKITAIDAKGFLAGTLEQPPLLEGALVAIENRTGEILAMIGGASFERSKFNRATQAMRQVGSLFKPFVYMAAIDSGMTVATEIDDTPASFEAGPGQPPYAPQNYDKEFRGTITLRQALEQSRNVPAVRLMDALGPAAVNRYPRRLGVTAPLPEYLSVAIGAAEATLLEMTSAYSALPNQGVRMEPLSVLDVTDRDGTLLEEQRQRPHEAIRADTAAIITEILRGVVQHGTAARANALNWTLAGKTGTTDDYTDAWFIGFDPDVTIGLWLGYDQKKTIGDKMTGTEAALPIWIEVMKAWVARRRTQVTDPPDFERPGNVVTVMTPRGPDVFIAGTAPGGR